MPSTQTRSFVDCRENPRLSCKNTALGARGNAIAAITGPREFSSSAPRHRRTGTKIKNTTPYPFLSSSASRSSSNCFASARRTAKSFSFDAIWSSS